MTDSLSPNVWGKFARKLDEHKILTPIVLAALLTGMSFVAQGRIHFQLGDEGYLWYGVQATVRGEVPIRDFQSYDPGRYYWTAAFAPLWGDGVMGVRGSLAIFQWLGLSLALVALRRSGVSKLGLGLVGLTLLLWMMPRHKVFECSLTMAAVFFADGLIRDPRARNHFIAGILVGLAAFFGRNHGVYTFLTFFTLIIFVHVRQLGEGGIVTKLATWGLGIVIGFAPMIGMILGIEGFYPALITSIFRRISVGANIARGIPAPLWLLPIGYIAAIVYSLRTLTKENRGGSLLLASAVVGLVYAHHAFSRADINHIAQSIAPALIGITALPLAIPARLRPVGSILSTIGLIWFAIGAVAESPIYKMATEEDEKEYVDVRIAGTEMKVRKSTVRTLEEAKAAYAEHVPEGSAMLIAPYYPSLYPALGLQSPIHEIYLLRQQSGEVQESYVRAMDEGGVDWALLSTRKIDHSENKGLAKTHPIFWDYLMENFEPVQEIDSEEVLVLYRRR